MPSPTMVLFTASPARLFDCSPNISGNKSSQSWLHRESFTQEELAWSPIHKGGDDRHWKQAWEVHTSLRGQNRNRASRRKKARLCFWWSSGRQQHGRWGGGITWEGVQGTGRGDGTECYSTQTSPCSGGTLCQGRSLHAP